MQLPALVTLADGHRVTLRPIRPDDAGALDAMFHRLSAESRYQRFFGGINHLSPAMLRYLTEVDGDRHIAIVAVMPGDEGERIVGVARCVRDPDKPTVAEAAFTVVDDMQQKGLGTRLLAEITALARGHGVYHFRLEVKHDNAAMRRLIDEAGGELVSAEGGVVTYDIPLRTSPMRVLFELLAQQTLAVFALWGRAAAPRAPDAEPRREA